ncbi:helix-turn-helix domain-containing protein [Streptomyces sp. NPDC053048]|uniref:helix-turn-helix domain-containing protein n=1 Tax=Streptomyces sp. NPDC053048 TaxID=3365694 RepID=UPI0037CE83FC
MSDFADLARRALRDSGYSMSAAARAINYDLAYLSRVLNGKQQPSVKLAEALDRLVEAGGALAGTVLNADDQSRVARSAGQSSRVDAGTVDALSRVLVAYRRLDDVLDPRSVIPATLMHVDDITRMLKGARGAQRERLTAVASEFAQFAGWMLAQVRRDDEAVSMLTQALELADAIEDGTLAAQALNFRGYLARRQGRQQGVARWYAAAARTPGAHPAQRLGDLLQSAAGLAELGETGQALRVADEAERLSDLAAAVPPPETAYWLTPEFNRLNMGLCTLALGRYDEAVDHFSTGLAGLPDEQQGAAWTQEHRDALRRAVASR